MFFRPGLNTNHPVAVLSETSGASLRAAELDDHCRGLKNRLQGALPCQAIDDQR
jgi:hypothetical protein